LRLSRRGNAPLLFLGRSSSRLLCGFSPSFLSGGLELRFQSCLSLSLYRSLTIRFFGSDAPRFRFRRAPFRRLLGPASCLGFCDLSLGFRLGSPEAFCFLGRLAFGLGLGLRRLTPRRRFSRATTFRFFGGPATSFGSGSTHRFAFCRPSLLQLGRLTFLFLARRPTVGRLLGALLLRQRPGRIGFGLPTGRALRPLGAKPVDFLGGFS